jgi:hypothetical protein
MASYTTPWDTIGEPPLAESFPKVMSNQCNEALYPLLRFRSRQRDGCAIRRERRRKSKFIADGMDKPPHAPYTPSELSCVPRNSSRTRRSKSTRSPRSVPAPSG